MPRILSQLLLVILFLSGLPGSVTGSQQQLVLISAAHSVLQTDLLQQLADRFEATHPDTKIKLIGKGSLQALDEAKDGQVDLIITHNPKAERKFMRDGHGLLRAGLMQNQLVLYGPTDDPHDLGKQPGIIRAMHIIAEKELPFLLPHSYSGTNKRISNLWQVSGITPNWIDYQQTGTSPMNTLEQANTFNAYTIADSTSYTVKKSTLQQIRPLLTDSEMLTNPFSIIVVNNKRTTSPDSAAMQFFDFITSIDGQVYIKKYGSKQYGVPLYTPSALYDPVVRQRYDKRQQLKESQQQRLLTVLIIALTIGSIVGFMLLMKLIGNHRQKILALEKSLQLETSQLKAEQASQAKSSFLANMSHEIRTPLTAIIGFAEEILDSKLSKEQRLVSIKRIINNSKHLRSLINDILDLSKIEAGKFQIENIEVEFFPLIYEIENLIRPHIEKKKLEFEIYFNYPLPEFISTDPLRLKQIITNLCSNAVKFTHEGYVQLHISCDPPNDSVQFIISDSGIGMDEDTRVRVFEPFTQSDPSNTRLYGGTGLGLSLSKRFARMLGGSLTVTSKPNEGSVFTLKIHSDNLAQQHMFQSEFELPTNTSTDITEDEIKPLSGKVLMVDDNEVLQELFVILLTNLGLHTTVANNGKEALDLIHDNNYDLVIMDLQMPVMDGLTAIKLLRRQNSKLPVIALTANALQSQKDACLNAGFNDFIPKPIDRYYLYSRLSMYLPFAQTENEFFPAVTSRLLEQSEQFAPTIARFVEKLPATFDEIIANFHQHNWQQLNEQVHTLKGSGGSLGYPALSDLCNKIEFQLANEDYKQVRSLLDELDLLIKRISAGILDTDQQQKSRVQ